MSENLLCNAGAGHTESLLHKSLHFTQSDLTCLHTLAQSGRDHFTIVTCLQSVPLLLTH